MEIKGLIEALGISAEQADSLRKLKAYAAAQRIMFYSRILSMGGTIHRSNPATVAKRRRKNKLAKASRRMNRS